VVKAVDAGLPPADRLAELRRGVDLGRVGELLRPNARTSWPSDEQAAAHGDVDDLLATNPGQDLPVMGPLKSRLRSRQLGSISPTLLSVSRHGGKG
jgi:hypothetical protein